MKTTLAHSRTNDKSDGQERSAAAARGHAPAVSSLLAIDWSRLAACQAVMVGVGAVGRALVELLAHLGLRRFVLIDPKPYRAVSVATQCEPDEVGRPKAIVLGERLRRLGAEVTTFVRDVYDVEPGHVEPDAIVIVSADNRRADIGANRLAAQMRVRLVKANVEPALLLAGIRCYDLRGARPETCLECQLTDAQYAQQWHPASCEGPDGPHGRPSSVVRSTGSPRALTQIAASATALAVAQLVGSSTRGESTWFARQWQLNLLTGQATWSQLGPKPACRWDHTRHWRSLRRLSARSDELTLSGLIETACCGDPADTQLLFPAELPLSPAASGAACWRRGCPGCGRGWTKLAPASAGARWPPCLSGPARKFRPRLFNRGGVGRSLPGEYPAARSLRSRAVMDNSAVLWSAHTRTLTMGAVHERQDLEPEKAILAG